MQFKNTKEIPLNSIGKYRIFRKDTYIGRNLDKSEFIIKKFSETVKDNFNNLQDAISYADRLTSMSKQIRKK